MGRGGNHGARVWSLSPRKSVVYDFVAFRCGGGRETGECGEWQIVPVRIGKKYTECQKCLVVHKILASERHATLDQANRFIREKRMKEDEVNAMNEVKVVKKGS